jgi:hypothetical protein
MPLWWTHPTMTMSRHYRLFPKARAWCHHRFPNVNFLERAVHLSQTPRMRAERVRREPVKQIEQRSVSDKRSD